EEQRAIAQTLSDVDGLIAALDKLIAKKRNIKTATMQELLAGKKRLPGFGEGKGYKNTEVGVIPEDWEVKHLKNALKTTPQYGINAPAVPYRDNLPVYIRITDISESGYFTPEKLVSVNQENSDQYYLEEGDLVFARTGSVGKSYLYNPDDGELVFAVFLIRIRPDENILLPHYLAQYVKTKIYWNWVKLMSMRTVQPGINGNEYGQLLVALPAIEEQRAIASILSDMDAEIAALEKHRAKTQAMKQGMMQELLTGKTRLIVPNNP
ncbi:MAG: restriction endonuclease subunit S, partial [Hormoscilla sp. SP5CHS1]|nr:restriction endonuclease subunit S [Hormoscilla sp. SP12CHS1]MBC6456190.1 restriction endonuclease subunit S [Hormoscilla sp. SP5CHS1]